MTLLMYHYKRCQTGLKMVEYNCTGLPEVLKQQLEKYMTIAID